MVGVILLHASGSWTVTTQQVSQMGLLQTFGWSVVDFYQSVARMGIPLFLMLTGALLLQPEKNESLRTFFRKRWNRIGLPFIFWGAAYFAWDFLVIRIPFTLSAVIWGILDGPYTQFWYLYVLIGLYLLTPILRAFINQADQTLLLYFVVIWLLGAAIIPVFGLLTPYQLNSNVFTITGYVGYFVLGTYLLTAQMRRSTLSILMILGVALTGFFTYVLAATVGGTEMYFFQQYFSPTVILSSVMLFMLLLMFKPPVVQEGRSTLVQGGSNLLVQKEISNVPPPRTNKLIKAISANTLAIYLFHVMVLESLENGYFGFAINRTTLNPIIEVTLMTAIVLFVSLGVILLLKKVPYLRKLIG